MGIDHSKHKPGQGSASIVHKFDIRQRKFGKKWHVYDYVTNSTVYESVRKGACVKWVQNHEDLFHLAASHDWGMMRQCPTCNVLRRLERFRLNHNTYGSGWRSDCMECENMAGRKRARKREEDRNAAPS